MKRIIRILKIIVTLFRNKEYSIYNVVRNLYFNLCKANLYQESYLICGKHTDLKMAKRCHLSLNANLYVGKRDIDKTHYHSWIWIMDRGRINVEGNFTLFEGASIHIHKGGILTLEGGYMSENASIVCENNIRIGHGCAIAPGVVIRDCDSHEIVGSPTSKPITIGAHVWIGTNAIILKGVTIGSGAVVAAGAIVTKDVPANCVVAGNPAKIVKSNIIWK